MRKLRSWLDEYGESHQDHTNKAIHWICVPVIFFSIVGLLYSVRLPIMLRDRPYNLAIFALLAVTIYYFMLSWKISIGMFLFSVLCLYGCKYIERHAPIPLWQISIILFVAAWVGQFVGHKIEGKKPSFLKDFQFLLIGPAWLMSFVYKKLGIRV